MKTLIYTNTGLTSRQIGLNTEVLENLKKDGKELKLVLCDNVLQNCYFNRPHNVLGCASCQSRQTHLLKKAGISSDECVSLQPIGKTQSLTIPTFNSLNELLTFDYNGIEIGRGAASSIISYTRDFHVTSEKYGELIEIELKKSFNVLLNFEKIISEFQPDEIYLFNGRFAEVWPLIELTRKYKIPYYCIESGSKGNFELFENSLPHSIEAREKVMNSIWINAQNDKVRVSKDWFNSKRDGSTKSEINYTGKQQKETLPAGFNKNKTNIAITNSSEDELKAISEWKNDMYSSQNEAIEQIARYYADRPEFHFYLRVHPNLGKVDNIQIREINEMNFPNLTIIEPFAEVDTYALIEACDKVIAFGSTAGIEATYWGKPSILYGKAFYMNFDVTYNPNSFEELTSLIETIDLAPKQKENTYPYAYYWTAFGTPTKHFKFNGLDDSTYKGKKIKKLYLSTIWYLLKYLKSIPHWIKTHKTYYKRPFRIKDIFTYK